MPKTWIKPYPNSVQFNPSTLEVASVDLDLNIVVEKYDTKEKYRQERDYSFLWRKLGGQGLIMERADG